MQWGQGETPMWTLFTAQFFFIWNPFFVNISDVLHIIVVCLGNCRHGWTVCRPTFVGLAESWSCRKDANTKWLCFLVHVLCGDNLQTNKTLVLVLTHNKVHDTLVNLYYEVTQTCRKRTQENEIEALNSISHSFWRQKNSAYKGSQRDPKETNNK